MGGGKGGAEKGGDTLMGLFSDIFCPALKTLALLEERGIPLDVQRRDEFRKETIDRLGKASKRIMELAQEAHSRRLERVREAIAGLETEAAKALEPAPCCTQHPSYAGLTKRSKDECCRRVYEGAATLRAVVKDLSSRCAAGKAKLEQIGPRFDPKNDWHWRFLLFDPLGLGLAPVAWTGKKGEPKVDDDAIEKLQRRHPGVELLRLRVEVQQSKTRLKNRLNVEPEADGRVHSPYSLARTWNCRISSGDDDEETDKARVGEGNLQNIPERDRAMYRAEPGKVFVYMDYSQVEARVFAWLARDVELLQAWRRGLDIHRENAQVIARALGIPLAPGTEDDVPFPHDPGGRSFRQAGKLTHKLHYGMGKQKFSDTYGIPVAVCDTIIRAYFDAHPRLRAFIAEEAARATRDRRLTNPYGARVYFYHWRQKDGVWEIADREEALSYRTASGVACRILEMLPKVDALPGELLTTTHDSFLAQVEESPEAVGAYIGAARELLESPWPQLGEIPGLGAFSCPVDFKVGRRWAPKKYDAEGLEGFEEWLARGTTGADSLRTSVATGETRTLASESIAASSP